MNVVSLVGTVGRAIDLRYTKRGTAACTVVLGVDRPHRHEVTDWVRVQAYGRTAEWLSQWMAKGDRLWVVGSLCCDSWQDRQGETHHMWYVLAERAGFAERKRRDSGTVYRGPDGVEYEEADADAGDGELPF